MNDLSAKEREILVESAKLFEAVGEVCSGFKVQVIMTALGGLIVEVIIKNTSVNGEQNNLAAVEFLYEVFKEIEGTLLDNLDGNSDTPRVVDLLRGKVSQ